jgi:hypothetical protein
MTVIVVRCEVGDTSESRDEISEQRAISVLCTMAVREIHSHGWFHGATFSSHIRVFSRSTSFSQIPNPKNEKLWSVYPTHQLKVSENPTVAW